MSGAQTLDSFNSRSVQAVYGVTLAILVITVIFDGAASFLFAEVGALYSFSVGSPHYKYLVSTLVCLPTRPD
jgi:hypothetical protein